MFGKKKKPAKQSEPVWCPTQKGTYTAYYPEWLKGKDWERIKITRASDGIPQPAWHGGINDAIYVCGYAQAKALAWEFAAMMESEGRDIEVRAQAYEVVYDIKARKIDPPQRKEM